MSVSGTGTVPSTVSGDATVVFDIALDQTTKKWSGTVFVNDPGAGFAVTVPNLLMALRGDAGWDHDPGRPLGVQGEVHAADVLRLRVRDRSSWVNHAMHEP